MTAQSLALDVFRVKDSARPLNPSFLHFDLHQISVLLECAFEALCVIACPKFVRDGPRNFLPRDLRAASLHGRAFLFAGQRFHIRLPKTYVFPSDPARLVLLTFNGEMKVIRPRGSNPA